MMSLGAFPAVSLKEAREKRDTIKKQIAAGIDPSLRKKLDKIGAASANSFGAIADEYIANLEANDAADMTISKNRWLLEDLAAPIRNRPVSEILPAELLDILKRVEGGYFMVGTVIAADMDLIGQLQPNTPVRFVTVGMDEALAARHDRAGLLAKLRSSLA